MTACAFITVGHPCEPLIERIRCAMEQADRPGASTPRATRTVRQHELKGVLGPTGEWQIDRFYASSHSWEDSRPMPFAATTYHYDGSRGTGHWFQFPYEPYLTALDSLKDTEQPHVLQYVVLRRLTFRARTSDGTPYIGKFKRRSRARNAHDVLALVSAAAGIDSPSFRIPSPVSYDEARHLFHQEALSGRPLSDLLDAANIEALLYAAGRVQAELHELPVPNLPMAGETCFDTLVRNCRWVTFFRQTAGAHLAAVRETLRRSALQLPPVTPATCHGDFVCSHLLYGPDGWAVVDFDLAHRGDAHTDVALLLASLTEDVPLLNRAWRNADLNARTMLDSAAAAFVEGYQARARHPLNRRRLLWQRIVAEIHMLGLMFTKDRFNALAFDRSLDLIERLARELSRAKAGVA